MNYILVIVAASALVPSSLAQACPSKADITSKCLADNHMDTADYIKYNQDAGFEPEKIKAKCSLFPEYSKVYECMSAEFTRCSIADKGFPSSEDVSEMGQVCNDTNIRYDCIEKVPQMGAELQSCMAAHSSSINPAIQTPEQTTCETAKVSIQCVVDLVAKCDSHTASLVAAMSKGQISSSCAGTVVG